MITSAGGMGRIVTIANCVREIANNLAGAVGDADAVPLPPRVDMSAPIGRLGQQLLNRTSCQAPMCPRSLVTSQIRFEEMPGTRDVDPDLPHTHAYRFRLATQRWV